MAVLLLVLAACGGDKESGAGGNDQKEKKSKEKYVLATDDDFISYSDFLKRYEYDDVYEDLTSVSRDASWYYIGEEEYVEIPEKIHGEEVIQYGGMFACNTTVKGVKSTNPNVRTTSGMFQFMDVTESSGVLDLTEFDVRTIVEADSMFQGAKLDGINFGDKEFTELTEAKALFKHAEIKDLNLSTLTFPKLEELREVFYGYKGENLNANIPSLPSLVRIKDLITGEAEIESLEINNLDVSNVSEVRIAFGNFTLGGDSIIDISKWTLPNVEREVDTVYYEDGSESTVEYVKARLIDGYDDARDIAGIDVSSLDGAIHLRNLMTSSSYQKVKVKGENEYEEYLKNKKYMENDFEIVENDISRPEIYANEEKWQEAVRSHERKKKNLEEFEIEVVEQ